MKNFLKLIFLGISSAPCLEMYHSQHEKIKKMPAGFNFQFLLFANFFGLPLFASRLWFWAVLMFSLTSAQFYSYYIRFKGLLLATTEQEIEAFGESTQFEDLAGKALILLAVLLAFKGNEWAVKRLLKKGWRFKNPEDKLVQKMAKKWKIPRQYLRVRKHKEEQER